MTISDFVRDVILHLNYQVEAIAQSFRSEIVLSPDRTAMDFDIESICPV